MKNFKRYAIITEQQLEGDEWMSKGFYSHIIISTLKFFNSKITF